MEHNKIFTSKVLMGGKITIPIEIREIHGIKENDTLTLTICSITKEKKKQ